jgi:hypothetical protein
MACYWRWQQDLNRAGRRRADRWRLAARVQRLHAVEVVVKGPDDDVLGRELAALPASGFVSGRGACLDSARRSRGCVRTGAAFRPVRSSWRPRSVRAHHPGGDSLVLREVEELHELRRWFGSVGRRPGGRTRPARSGRARTAARRARWRPSGLVKRPACTGSHDPLELLVGCSWPGRPRTHTPATPSGRPDRVGPWRNDRRLPG